MFLYYSAYMNIVRPQSATCVVYTQNFQSFENSAHFGGRSHIISYTQRYIPQPANDSTAES